MRLLLNDYISLLRGTNTDPADPSHPQSYHISSNTVSPDEWAEFENVYQIHCPKLFIDSAVRDVRKRCCDLMLLLTLSSVTAHDAVLLLFAGQTRVGVPHGNSV